MTTPHASFVRSLPSSPTTSRQNSITSLNSTQSEPARSSSTSSTRNTFSNLFSRKHKQPKPAATATTGLPVLTSKYTRAATAATTKTLLDQQRQNPAQSRNTAPNPVVSRHSTAYAYEQRRPHSGPPALRAAPGDSLPKLARIESSREPVDDGVPGVSHHNRGRDAKDTAERSLPPGSTQGDDYTKSNSIAPSGVYGSNIRPRARIAGRSFHRDQTGRWTKDDTGDTVSSTAGTIPTLALRSHG